jgi:hypothetical protein
MWQVLAGALRSAAASRTGQLAARRVLKGNRQQRMRRIQERRTMSLADRVASRSARNARQNGSVYNRTFRQQALKLANRAWTGGLQGGRLGASNSRQSFLDTARQVPGLLQQQMAAQNMGGAGNNMFWQQPFSWMGGNQDSGESESRMRQLGTGFVRLLGPVGRFASAISDTVRAVHGFANTLSNAQRGTMKYSGAGSLAFAQLDTNRLFREMHKAKETEKSTVKLTQALDKLEEAMEPWEIGFQNATNKATTWITEKTTGFLNWLNQQTQNWTGRTPKELLDDSTDLATGTVDQAIGMVTGNSQAWSNMGTAAGATAVAIGSLPTRGWDGSGQAVKEYLGVPEQVGLSRSMQEELQYERSLNRDQLREYRKRKEEEARARMQETAWGRQQLAQADAAASGNVNTPEAAKRDAKAKANPNILADMFGMQLQKHALKAAKAPKPGIPDRSAKVQADGLKKMAQQHHVAIPPMPSGQQRADAAGAAP